MTSTAARSVVAGLLLSAAAEAGAVETGIGASAMAGSGGYRRLGLSADAAWTGKRVEPYAWGEGGLSRDLRAFAFGGGAWNNWSERERGKAGLGLAAGRYDGGRSVAALLAELGAENDFDAATLGAGWGLTYGSLAGSRGAPSLEQTASARSRGRRAAASAAEVYSV
ncbi:MAG: hypothetical protein HY403_08020, partial [Elusimicrobia bacterium]|nr:hypothetical protein [Elusimicrobiota bacterium]